MLFLELFRVEIEVVNLAARALARLPRTWKWRFQTFLSNVEQISILVEVHTQILGIFFDFLTRRVVVFIKLFLKDLETIGHESLAATA